MQRCKGSGAAWATALCVKRVRTTWQARQGAGRPGRPVRFTGIGSYFFAPQRPHCSLRGFAARSPTALPHPGDEDSEGEDQGDDEEGHAQGILNPTCETAVANVYPNDHREDARENCRPAQHARDQTSSDHRSPEKREGQPQQNAELALKPPLEPPHRLGIGESDLLVRP